MKKKLADTLDQYGGFHDSKVKRIYVETNRCIFAIVIDYAYDTVPSATGEVVVPDEKGGVPKRRGILYRPMTVVFKDVVQVIMKTEPDPINEEVILSCQLAEDRKERSSGTDVVHVKVTLSSLSKFDIFCRELECKTQET
jgi:hypothetical protein